MAHTRPNVLFILGDDWGWGDLGCFGHDRVMTPNLDQLASEGTRFTQFYVASPVCSPSRASFMTGLFPARCGFHHICGSADANLLRGVPDFLGLEYPTVSRELQLAGYNTAHFGKWHLGSIPTAPNPGSYGFDEHCSVNSSGPFLRDCFSESGDMTPSSQPVPELDVAFRPHSSRVIVDHAIEWLEQNVGDHDPFYLQLWLLDPHAILDPPVEQVATYGELSPQASRHSGAMAIYYSVLTEADRHLGRLFAALERLNLTQDTIVVFTGDNGPEDFYVPNASHSAAGSAGPFRGRKRSLYEGGIRMPLIVRWPGKTPPGLVNDSSVISSVDLFPTLCSIVGLSAPLTDGEDMQEAWHGGSWGRSRPIMWEYRFPNGSHPVHCSPALAVRLGDWKLLLNPDLSRVELYNIPEDPMEVTNRVSEYPDVVSQLTALVGKWADELPDGPRHPEAGSNAYAWPRSGTAVKANGESWESGW